MRKLFGFGRQHATLLTAALLAFMFVSLLDESADSQVVIGGNDRFRNRESEASASIRKECSRSWIDAAVPT